jgi:hypothetical protein
MFHRDAGYLEGPRVRRSRETRAMARRTATGSSSSNLPQVVDVVANPEGPRYLARDVARAVEWFTAHGLPPEVGTATLLAQLHVELGLR